MTGPWGRSAEITAALHRYFPKLRQFLPGQREALEGVLNGRDVIAVLPTGGGKTLVYQLAGLLLEGTTVVATPLIALMQDQVRRLREDSHLPVAALSGSLRGTEREQVLATLAEGSYGFVFSTPEQLSRHDVRAALSGCTVDLFCVDEAHCISEWGYDFRPAYRELAAARQAMGGPPVLALTATAPETVRRDVAVELVLRWSWPVGSTAPTCISRWSVSPIPSAVSASSTRCSGRWRRRRSCTAQPGVSRRRPRSRC